MTLLITVVLAVLVVAVWVWSFLIFKYHVVKIDTLFCNGRLY